MIVTAPRIKTDTIHHFLVIGYGNERQGDDGAGPSVAKAVNGWNLPLVKTLAVPYLSPDLTDEIANAKHVIFVDACSDTCAQSVKIEPIVVCPRATDSSALSQPYTPCTLLKLTQTQHGRHPCAWLLQVAAERFEMDSELSGTAYHSCDRALQIIARFFNTYQCPQWASPDGAATADHPVSQEASVIPEPVYS